MYGEQCEEGQAALTNYGSVIGGNTVSAPSSSSRKPEQSNNSASSSSSSSRSNNRRAGVILAGSLVVVMSLGLVAVSYKGSNVMNTFDISQITKTLSLAKTAAADFNTMPNIIFFLADDVGYSSLGEDITPFLTTLRSQGIGIENYYTQESSTPSRASLLTGRHPLTLGLQKFEHSVTETGGLSLDETIVPEVLKDNGYSTYLYGKWNLGNQSPRYLPTARGFDEFLGFLDGYNNYWSKLNPTYMNYMDFMSADKKCFNMYDSWDVNTYSTTLYKDKAVATIAAHDFRVGPMFLLMSFQAAQNPFADSNTEFPQGIPDDYLDADKLSYISKKIKVLPYSHHFLPIIRMCCLYFYPWLTRFFFLLSPCVVCFFLL